MRLVLFVITLFVIGCSRDTVTPKHKVIIKVNKPVKFRIPLKIKILPKEFLGSDMVLDIPAQ